MNDVAKKSPPHLYGVIVASFVLASVLTVYPLSAQFALARPMWLAIGLIFWLIFKPTMIGVGTAFFVGLIADVLTDSPLGQQALCAVVVAFLIKYISRFLKHHSANATWLLAAACLLVYQVGFMLLYAVTELDFAPRLLVGAIISSLVWPLWVAIFSRYTLG